MTRANKLIALVGACTVVIFGVMAFVPSLPQDQAYHSFADQRSWFGIPNAANVITNLGFALVGISGLWSLYFTNAGRSFRTRTWALPYAVFFLGVGLVAPGSATYHWSPDNNSLLWDRLPMSVAFMALLDAFVA
ncbi:MAG: hypothetical protein EPO08_02300 [Rhodospirillaceae bacterium]|nr:MAG: hypothetical protein EPO08_02300 [Rhodospirillaceae bacterium]